MSIGLAIPGVQLASFPGDSCNECDVIAHYWRPSAMYFGSLVARDGSATWQLAFNLFSGGFDVERE